MKITKENLNNFANTKFGKFVMAVGMFAAAMTVLYSLGGYSSKTDARDAYIPQAPAAEAAYNKAISDLQVQAVNICNKQLKDKASAKINDELNSSAKEDPQMDTWNAIRKADCTKAKVTVEWGF